MTDNTISKIKSLLKIEKIESYTENGCNIRPLPSQSMYRIDYWEAVNQAHPNAHEFGSMSTSDGHDAAIALAKELFGSVSVRLDIPTLVFTVKNEE